MADIAIFMPGFVDHKHRMQPLEIQIQIYIKQVFWPRSKASIAEYTSYFEFFQWAISVLAWPDGIDYNEQFAMKTYGDLAKITKCMEANHDLDRLLLAHKLQREFPSSTEGQVLRSVDLIARLWLNLHVRSGDYPLGPSLSDMTDLEWMGQASLKELIRDCFQASGYASNEQHKYIDTAFTVENLRKICRVNVQWTANLKDHLSYDRSTSTLHLFPHKICLISHLESCHVLPHDFVSETIQTLDLLFPFGQEGTRKYLDQTGQTFYRTSSRDLSRATDFGEFRYWRKRLEDLHDVFHQTPRNISQLWYDRRNPLQWWTFWLAALIALLSIVFGIISAYTSFQQVALARENYELSVLQACSQGNFSADICGK